MSGMTAGTALDWDHVRAWRGRRHHLTTRATDPDRVVSALCGLHAQLASSAELTLHARVEGLARGWVAGALWARRALVKTWAMRGTLHLAGRRVPALAGGPVHAARVRETGVAAQLPPDPRGAGRAAGGGAEGAGRPHAGQGRAGRRGGAADRAAGAGREAADELGRVPQALGQPRRPVLRGGGGQRRRRPVRPPRPVAR